jgi:hypothetical protein
VYSYNPYLVQKAVFGMPDSWLMITQSQVNLGKDTCSFHLVEQILDLGRGYLFFNGHFIQGPISSMVCLIIDMGR